MKTRARLLRAPRTSGSWDETNGCNLEGPRPDTNELHALSDSDQRATRRRGLLGWTLDAFDFFLVVMTLTAIARNSASRTRTIPCRLRSRSLSAGVAVHLRAARGPVRSKAAPDDRPVF